MGSGVCFWFQRLVPCRYRNDFGTEGRRACLVVTILLLILAVDLGVGGTRIAAGIASPWAMPVAIVSAALLVYFRYTGRLREVAHGIAALMVGAFAVGAWSTGGIASSILLGLAVVPLIATLLGGHRNGALWAVLSLGVVLSYAAWELVRAESVAFADLLPPTLAIVAVFVVGAAQEHRRRLAETASRRAIEPHTLGPRLANAECLAALHQTDRTSSIGLLAAGMAHEINNPLTSLMGNLAYLERELPRGASETQVALADAQAATRRIRAIVRDLRLVGRDEHSPLSPLTLASVVGCAVELARREVPDGTRLVVSHEPCGTTLAVEHQLVQAVLNLLVNAGEAVAKRGSGKRGSGKRGFGRQGLDEHRIVVRTFEDDEGRPTLEVTDTGDGFSPETIDQLTQPFFTSKPPGRGAGLGLAVCDGIVRQLGGELRMRNRPTGGACVSIHLPPAGSRTAARFEPAPIKSGPVPKRTRYNCRVLVVDDEPLVRRALRRLLREHEVMEADGGIEALQILRTAEPFDLILCDVMMPHLTGIDVYQSIRQDWPGLERRVVFMTGGAFDCRVKRMFDALADRPTILDKPIERAQLDEVLAAARPCCSAIPKNQVPAEAVAETLA